MRETDRPTCVSRKKQAAAKEGNQQEEMAPLKLYGMPLSPNVVRVATVLNEKGLDFEIIPVDLTTGAHKQPDFLALNVRLSTLLFSPLPATTTLLCCSSRSSSCLLFQTALRPDPGSRRRRRSPLR